MTTVNNHMNMNGILGSTNVNRNVNMAMLLFVPHLYFMLFLNENLFYLFINCNTITKIIF